MGEQPSRPCDGIVRLLGSCEVNLEYQSCSALETRGITFEK